MVKPIADPMRPPPPSARRNRGEPSLQRLRREILTGRYQPGERLPPERELASRLGTNRNTLREALRTLEADHLVQSRQGDGTIVLDWRVAGEINLLPHFLAEETPALERLDAVSTLLDLRTLLVEQVITLAVENGTEDDWGNVFEAFENLRSQRNGPAAVIADVQLFRAITQSTHNLVLIWVFNTFSKIFVELGRRFPHLWRIDEAYLRSMDHVVHDLRLKRDDLARRRISKLLEERTEEVTRQLVAAGAAVSATPVEKSPPRRKPRSRRRR
jgi:GntR family transcriptional repressor for pyruvate dehydrogenase complex